MKRAFLQQNGEAASLGLNLDFTHRGRAPVLRGCRQKKHMARCPSWPRQPQSHASPSLNGSQPGSVGCAGPGAGLCLWLSRSPEGMRPRALRQRVRAIHALCQGTATQHPLLQRRGSELPSVQSASRPSFCPRADLKGVLETQHQEGNAWQVHM